MNFTYLALGDSYTIGEQVLLTESFPYQTVQLLRQAADGNESSGQHAGGLHFTAPEIIAKTGWTTDELHAAIQKNKFLDRYDLVSLLIGVNNQYRGRSAASFQDEFIQLLQKAISLAGNDPSKVFVLSIPDWGVTPFAEGRDREQIANEIREYNAICQAETEALQCNYIDITTSQKMDGDQVDYLAADGLHPNALEYAKWASQLARRIKY